MRGQPYNAPTAVGLAVWVILTTLVGCEWDPRRENPLDPGSDRYQPDQFGSLAVQVLTLSQQPIANAKVELLTEPVLSFRTDANGWVYFNNVPAETLTVQAFTDNVDNPIYALRSRQVVIRRNTRVETSLNLNAIPYFLSAVANAFTYGQYPGTTSYQLRIKSKVDDPDGSRDIDRVQWRWSDEKQELSGGLDYRQDSSFYESWIPDTMFRNGIEDVLGAAVHFEVFDMLGSSVRYESASPLRVIQDAPEAYDATSPVDLNPVLRWDYNYSTEFQSITQFNYFIQIFKITHRGQEVVYDTLLTPSLDRYGIEHRVNATLERGSYEWYVWVLDLYGNSSRSALALLTIEGN